MHEVLGVFLVEQRRRLARRTFDAYDSVVEELSLFLHDHGPETLERAERLLLNSTPLACGCAQRDYLTSYGPEHMLRNLDRFLAVHRGPLRIADQRRAQLKVRVVRKLRTWLTDAGWCEAGSPSVRGRTAPRPDLAAGRRLAKTLAGEIAALELDFEDIDSDDDLLDAGLQDVSKIVGEDLWFRYWPEAGPARTVGPVHFPSAAKCLQPGWAVGCTLGRVGGRWFLFALSCVYPV
jgi:hypothetical protein